MSLCFFKSLGVFQVEIKQIIILTLIMRSNFNYVIIMRSNFNYVIILINCPNSKFSHSPRMRQQLDDSVKKKYIYFFSFVEVEDVCLGGLF